MFEINGNIIKMRKKVLCLPASHSNHGWTMVLPLSATTSGCGSAGGSAAGLSAAAAAAVGSVSITGALTS